MARGVQHLQFGALVLALALQFGIAQGSGFLVLQSGGALCAYNGRIAITDGTFVGNLSTAEGGVDLRWHVVREAAEPRPEEW